MITATLIGIVTAALTAAAVAGAISDPNPL